MNTLRLLEYKHFWLLPFLFFVLLPFSSFYNIPIIILVLTGVYLLILRFSKINKDPRFIIYFLLFSCIYLPMLIASVDAINPDEALRKNISFIIYLMFGVSIITFCFIQEKSKRYFINAVGILLFLWTLDGLWQYYFDTNILGYPIDWTNRLTGVFYPHYRIGIVMAILSPFYFEFIRYQQSKFIISWILIIPFILVILLSGSRTSWFMFFLSSFFYLAYYFRAGYHSNIHYSKIIYGLIILFVMFYSINVIKPEIPTKISSFINSRVTSLNYSNGLEDHNALVQRIQIWETGLRVVSEHWLNGIGVRGFRYIDKINIDKKDPVITDVTRMSTHPHQITLEIFIETGIIGIIGFTIFWILLIRFYLIGWRNCSHRENLLWFIPVLVATFPLNMHKSFYGHFSSVFIWVLISIAVANISSVIRSNE